MGAEEYYCEGDKEYPIGAFAEDEHREDNADKWCNGIECRCQEGVEDCFMEFAGHTILNLGVKIRKKQSAVLTTDCQPLFFLLYIRNSFGRCRLDSRWSRFSTRQT